MRRALLTAALACAATAADAQSRGANVHSYLFQITLPDTGSSIAGMAGLRVANPNGADSLAIDILLPVDSVTVNAHSVRVGRRDGGITVPLDSHAPWDLVDVWYHGTPTDGLIISRDPAGRWQAFGDNWPNRGRHWLPLVDTPSDKAIVYWIIDAPARLAVVANGVLLSHIPQGPRTRWEWVEEHPLPTYLMVLAAAEMRADTLRDTIGVTQRVWRSPDVAKTPPAFAEAPAIVGFYSSIVAPFPYRRLDHLQSSTRFGGMENATEIFYADQTFRSQTMSVGLIAHETAHQWFGDAVTEQRWAELWLSEGFATYFANLYTEHSRGHDAFVGAMRRLRDEILGDEKAVARRPVIDTIETDPLQLLNTNSYQKGGFVLHMARRLVGDSAFFRGVRDYWWAHRDSNATSADLRAALEERSGKELGWFFDQWLRRPGYPELATGWSYDRAARRVYLEITQGPRFGSFRFPLVVEVTRSDGTTARATVEVPARAQSRVAVPLELAAPPRGLVLDPDADLLAAIGQPRMSKGK